jgi:hypothetical protein
MLAAGGDTLTQTCVHSMVMLLLGDGDDAGS